MLSMYKANKGVVVVVVVVIIKSLNYKMSIKSPII